MRASAFLLVLALGAAPATVPDGHVAPAPEPAPSTPAQARDTSLTARRGDILSVQGFVGRLDIRGGTSDRVQVLPSPSDRESIGLSRAGGRIVLGDRDPKGRALERRVEVVVPAWLEIDVKALRVDVSVRGTAGPVGVHVVDGDITVDDVEGEVDVSTVTGDVRVTDARGRIRATSVSDEVRLVRVSGSIVATSTDGDVILDGVETSELEAQTVDGDVEFTGVLRSRGSFRFVTHDGDITVDVPRDLDVDVSVSTFDGDFSADFPVRLDRFEGGREMRFSLGQGGGLLLLQAFDGDIRLRYAR